MIVKSNNNERGLRIFITNENAKSRQSERNGKEKHEKSKPSASIYAGDLKVVKDKVIQKREEAQKKAMKVLGDVFSNDKKIDDGLEDRQSKIQNLREQMGEAQAELNKIEERKAALKESYGITDDSEEQKDLKLLEKRGDSFQMGSTIHLTDEEKKRLAEIDAKGMTKYQKRSFEYDRSGAPYREIIKDATDAIIEENAIIRETKKEMLKHHDMVDAQVLSDDIMKAAEDEIKGMLLEEAIDHIDEKMEEAKEAAEKKAEEEKEREEKLEAVKEERERMEELASKNNEVSKKEISTTDIPTEQMLELDSVTDAQKEIQDIADKMKLLTEDIKGAVVDMKM